MYIFGGRGDLSGSYHTGNELYDENIAGFDVLAHKWLEVKRTHDRPTGRRSHSACEYIVMWVNYT